MATYQDIATQCGEAAAKKSGLAKIRTLLATGIAAADEAAASADARCAGCASAAASAAAAAAAAGDDDDAMDTAAEADLERQRAERFRGWVSAIDDMASSRSPTLFWRLDLSSGFGTGEPKFCKTLDEHAAKLAASAAASEEPEEDDSTDAAAGATGMDDGAQAAVVDHHVDERE